MRHILESAVEDTEMVPKSRAAVYIAGRSDIPDNILKRDLLAEQLIPLVCKMMHDYGSPSFPAGPGKDSSPANAQNFLLIGQSPYLHKRKWILIFMDWLVKG
jgi:hypothetical protein